MFDPYPFDPVACMQVNRKGNPMTALTAELKAQMVNFAKFAHRGTGRTVEELQTHLESILANNTDAESLADSLRYYGFISDNQAIKMSNGLDWSFAKAGA